MLKKESELDIGNILYIVIKRFGRGTDYVR